MKVLMRYLRLSFFFGLLFSWGCAANGFTKPPDPEYNWVIGKWSSREKASAVHDIELSVGNGNELSGSTKTLYGNGDLVSGYIEKGLVDNAGNVEFTAYRPKSWRKTETYRLKKISDSVLEGQTSTGSPVRFIKLN